MFTAIDTVTNEDIPKYMDDMQRFGAPYEIHCAYWRQSVSLRLDDDVNRESETPQPPRKCRLMTPAVAVAAITA